MKNLALKYARPLATLALTFAPLVSHAAGFTSGVAFTAAEKQAHVEALPVILEDAASCLQEDLSRHQAFIKKYGVSAFYGDRGSFAKLSDADKRAYIKSLGKNPALLDQMAPTSCIGLTLKCLGRGFNKAGEGDMWKRLKAYTVANGGDGTALQDGLQKLGWKILYWNPNTSLNEAWDKAEAEHDPANSDHFWGEHAYNYSTAVKKGRYYLNHVDDVTSLVNFGTKPPKAIKNIPFFVGTAHMGYHVFPGSYGQIIEGHSTRRITDPKTLETAPFNPLGGGGPTEGEYRTGIIAVPPVF